MPSGITLTSPLSITISAYSGKGYCFEMIFDPNLGAHERHKAISDKI